jgi:hypothetical protein
VPRPQTLAVRFNVAETVGDMHDVMMEARRCGWEYLNLALVKRDAFLLMPLRLYRAVCEPLHTNYWQGYEDGIYQQRLELQRMVDDEEGAELRRLVLEHSSIPLFGNVGRAFGII